MLQMEVGTGNTSLVEESIRRRPITGEQFSSDRRTAGYIVFAPAMGSHRFRDWSSDGAGDGADDAVAVAETLHVLDQ